MRGKVTLDDIIRASGLSPSLVRKVAKGRELGDTASLAKSLGVHPSTVRRWKASGVPRKRLEEVAGVIADKRAVAQGEKKEKAKLKKLLSKARKKGVLPKSGSKGTKRFGGERAVGKKTIFHINQYLSVDVLETVEELTMTAPKGPRYIVTLWTVEAGTTGKVRGYGGIITKKLGKGAENIGFGTAITSGTFTNRRAALARLFEKLKDAIADAEALVYVIDLVVFSYRYRER